MTKILVDKAVIEKALEALGEATHYTSCESWSPSMTDDCFNIVTKLRAALENQFNPDWDRVEALQECLREHMAEIQRLRAALQQPQVEQEPAAWRCFDGEGDYEYRTEEPNKDTRSWAARYNREWEPLYTHSQNLNCKSNQHRLATLWGYEKPQPPRQPLTEEQIEIQWQFLHDEEGNPPDHHDFARAIEVAHGIGESNA